MPYRSIVNLIVLTLSLLLRIATTAMTHSLTTPDQVIQQLQWRYATKQFDPGRKISDAIWAALEQSLVLSPSSFGLQPWKFFVVRNPGLRQQLREHAWG